LKEKVYQHKFQTALQLQEAIVLEWNRMPMFFIRKAIDSWRARLDKVVLNESGHIERFC